MAYTPGNRIGDPARQCFVITPNDDNDLDPMPKAIRADGDGVIAILPHGSSVSVEHPVVDGERIDVICRRVLATGTTGQTNIIGYA